MDILLFTGDPEGGSVMETGQWKATGKLTRKVHGGGPRPALLSGLQ